MQTRLELVAAPGCASRAALTERVAVRSRRIEFVDTSERVTQLYAVISPTRDQRTGVTLTLVDPDGHRSVRRLVTQTCQEALNALALVIAISLDPNAALTDAAPPPIVEAPSPTPAPKPVRAPPSAPPSRHIPWAGAGGAFEAIVGPAPELMPGGALYFRLLWDRSSPWSPMLRVTGSHFERRFSGLEGTGATSPGETAGFSLNELSIELCPMSIGHERIGISYCALGGGGVLRASGDNTYDPKTNNRPWWVLGGSASLLLRPTRSLEISGNLRVGAPLVRDSFRFGSGEVFHHVSAVAYTGALGVGLTLP